MLGQVGRHNAFYEVPILTAKIRSELIFLLYCKLSKLSHYTIKSQEIGKIINLLSNDFNTIETKAPIFFASMIAPFGLAGIIAILITRFGWPGILIAAVIMIILPFQILIGKVNGTIMQKVNVFKDKRVKVCT